jgi:hypothetical protein
MNNDFNEIPEYDHFLGSPPIGDILYEDSAVAITQIITKKDLVELVTRPEFNKYRRHKTLEDVISELSGPYNCFGLLLCSVAEGNGYRPLYVLLPTLKFQLILIHLERGVRVSFGNIDILNKENEDIEAPLIEAVVNHIKDYLEEDQEKLITLVGLFGLFFKAYTEDHPFIERLREECPNSSDLKWVILATALRNFNLVFKITKSNQILGENITLENGVAGVKLELTYAEVSEFFISDKNVEAAFEGNWSSSNPDIYNHFILGQKELSDFIRKVWDDLSDESIIGIRDAILGRKIEWFSEKEAAWRRADVTEEFLTGDFAKSIQASSKDLREIIYAILSDTEGYNYTVLNDLYGVFRQCFADAGVSLFDKRLRERVISVVMRLLCAPINISDDAHVHVFIKSASIFKLLTFSPHYYGYDTLREWVMAVACKRIDFDDLMYDVLNSISFSSICREAVPCLNAKFSSLKNT